MITKLQEAKAEAWWRPYIGPVEPFKRKDIKIMSKQAKTGETASTNNKTYKTTRIEVFKTVMIAVLVTAIIAFVAGMNFANKQNAAVSSAASQSQTAVAPTTKK